MADNTADCEERIVINNALIWHRSLQDALSMDETARIVRCPCPVFYVSGQPLMLEAGRVLAVRSKYEGKAIFADMEIFKEFSDLIYAGSGRTKFLPILARTGQSLLGVAMYHFFTLPERNADSPIIVSRD